MYCFQYYEHYVQTKKANRYWKIGAFYRRVGKSLPIDKRSDRHFSVT